MDKKEKSSEKNNTVKQQNDSVYYAPTPASREK